MMKTISTIRMMRKNSAPGGDAVLHAVAEGNSHCGFYVGWVD